MRLSEASLGDVKEYIRVLDGNDDALIRNIMSSARGFVLSYTGLSAEEADENEEIYAAFLCLCSDMFDNRGYTVQNDRLNPIVKTILDMHRTNCIG